MKRWISVLTPYVQHKVYFSYKYLSLYINGSVSFRFKEQSILFSKKEKEKKKKKKTSPFWDVSTIPDFGLRIHTGLKIKIKNKKINKNKNKNLGFLHVVYRPSLHHCLHHSPPTSLLLLLLLLLLLDLSLRPHLSLSFLCPMASLFYAFWLSG